MHIKLWVDDAPVIRIDPDERVIKFIDKFITSRLPDPDKEPVLYDLVMKYQIHKCGPSCQRQRR